MSLAALLLLQAAQGTPAATPTPALPMPPADWAAMPELPLPPNRIAFDPSGYVRREVAAGRCRAAAGALAAPVAVLIDAAGAVSRVVPRAIDCPTVEQFTAGYVSALARRAGAGALRAGWYRYTVIYRLG